MKLESYLREQGVEFQQDSHSKTYTAQALAHAEHVTGYMVAKPVIVKTSSGFTMCVVPAPKQLDLERVAEVLNASNIRLATEQEMADLFPDCEVGAEPPVGKLYGLQTLMDAQLEEDEYLFMQAGSHTQAIKVKREDWQRLCNPQVANITLA